MMGVEQGSRGSGYDGGRTGESGHDGVEHGSRGSGHDGGRTGGVGVLS